MWDISKEPPVDLGGKKLIGRYREEYGAVELDRTIRQIGLMEPMEITKEEYEEAEKSNKHYKIQNMVYENGSREVGSFGGTESMIDKNNWDGSGVIPATISRHSDGVGFRFGYVVEGIKEEDIKKNKALKKILSDTADIIADFPHAIKVSDEMIRIYEQTRISKKELKEFRVTCAISSKPDKMDEKTMWIYASATFKEWRPGGNEYHDYVKQLDEDLDIVESTEQVIKAMNDVTEVYNEINSIEVTLNDRHLSVMINIKREFDYTKEVETMKKRGYK